MRIGNDQGGTTIYPVAVWAADGYKVIGLISLFKGKSPGLFPPPPEHICQYVHRDQLTSSEEKDIKKVYSF
ncbi:hypothetical protein D3C78_1931080 [compost metagenome]